MAAKAEDPLNKITPEWLEDFNRKKKDVQACIESVGVATKQIDSLIGQAATAYSPEDQEKISKQLQSEVKTAAATATRGKALLDKLKAEGEALHRTNPKSERLQPYRQQYMVLCKSYVDVMKAHQQVKERMRTTQQETLVRRALIVWDGKKTEAEIRDAAIADPAHFLQDAILKEASSEAKAAYVDAMSRARDIELLVRSINEVASMFQDLAVLINEQSAKLDSIEENVERAHVLITAGNKNLRDGRDAQIRTRKCYCCLICIAIVILLLLVAGLGTYFAVAFKKL